MQHLWQELGRIGPTSLTEARLQAHHAVQWLTRAARANLASWPDDSHTSLDWDAQRNALLSQPLTRSEAGPLRLGLGIAPLMLLLLQGEETLDALPLDGKREAEAGAWVDRHAAGSDLAAPSSATLPYAIPAHPVAAGGAYSSAVCAAEFSELARWFAAGHEILTELKPVFAPTGPSPSPARCWPHHFDMATTLRLAGGDLETAPSIGIGMSPGDDFYAQPYFYVSPWPGPVVEVLPAAPGLGHWHTKGFIGLVITGEALLVHSDRRAAAADFVAAAVTTSRRLLGAS